MSTFTCESVAHAALGEPIRREGAKLLYRCPRTERHANGDAHPSLKLNPKKDTWACFVCGASGTAWQLAAFLARLDPGDKSAVSAWLRDHGLLNETDRRAKAVESAARIVATYDFVDESGKLLFQEVRYEPKNFRMRRPDGKGSWIWNLAGTRRVLYRLPEVLGAESLLVCEGPKDCEAAQTLGIVATTNPNGAKSGWLPAYSECLRGKRVAVVADADEPGRKHAQQVAASFFGKVESVKVLELSSAKDLSEWVEKGGTRDLLLELIRNTPEYKPRSAIVGPLLVSVSIAELLEREIKPREMLLAPILPEQGLAMLYAYRGIGKTFIALGMAAAVASGSRFLRWTAPRPRRVLYLDGELPAKTIQERSAMVLVGMEGDGPGPDALRIITPDFQERPIPDLSTLEGQLLIEPHLEGIDLLVLDNLSALCRYGNENEGESWLPVQEWGLALRRRGISVLFIHHAGKNRSQRGTSRREDLLDTVITLKHPADYNPNEGLRCEVHFEKTRGLLGNAAKPFEVRLETGADFCAVWTLRDLEDAEGQRAAALFAEGSSVRDVAKELGISPAKAGRLRKKWQSGEYVEVSQSQAV